MHDEKNIKRGFLKDLKGMLREDSHEGYDKKLGHMKKVVVAAPTEEGLEKGLSTAEQILQKRKSLIGKTSPEKEESLPEDLAETLDKEHVCDENCDHGELESDPLEEKEEEFFPDFRDPEPEVKSDLSEHFDSLKDLPKEDMLKVVEFLQALIQHSK